MLKKLNAPRMAARFMSIFSDPLAEYDARRHSPPGLRVRANPALPE
jgi:hypothetical protein